LTYESDVLSAKESAELGEGFSGELLGKKMAAREGLA
jgi:hypothetical protein